MRIFRLFFIEENSNAESKEYENLDDLDSKGLKDQEIYKKNIKFNRYKIITMI